MILIESSLDLTNLSNYKNLSASCPSDFQMVRPTAWDAHIFFGLGVGTFSFFSFLPGKRVFSLVGGSISSQDGEALKFLQEWRGLISSPIFSLHSIDLSFKEPAPNLSTISSSVVKDSGTLDTVL